MPDPDAGDIVARATIEVPDPSFQVVLRRGHDIQTIFFRREDDETFAGVVGIVVPAAGVESVQRSLEGLIDAAVANGWHIREDTRR